jgi:hypothetical protein
MLYAPVASEIVPRTDCAPPTAATLAVYCRGGAARTFGRTADARISRDFQAIAALNLDQISR